MTEERAPADAGEPAAETDPGSRVPLYLQVASTLRTAIQRGIYPVGSRMPTEDALCARFGVSRHTVREALRQLRADGLIASRPGSRPTVSLQAPRRSEIFAGDWGEDFFDYTIGTQIRIASMGMARLPASLAEAAALPADEDWFCVTGYRVNIDDHALTCWNEYFIAAQYALVGRLLARHVGPVIPLLEDLFAERLARMTRTVEAVPMPEIHAASLGAVAGAPALRILVRCETAAGRTAMLHQSLHRTGAVTYTIRR